MPQELIGRGDLATNFYDHYKKELFAYGQEKNLSLSQTMNRYSLPDTQSPHRDALLETLVRMDLRTDPVGDLPASPIGEFLNGTDAAYLLGMEYVEQVFHKNIGLGTYTDIIDGKAELTQYGIQLDRAGFNSDLAYLEELDDHQGVTDLMEFATSTRGGVAYPFDPATHMIEERRRYQPRLQLRHVVAKRIPISGSTYQPGIIEQPDDTALRPVPEATPLPEYTLVTNEKTTNTQKVGYGLRVSDAVRNNNNMTMDLITQFQRQKAAQTEIALVNAAVQLLGAGDGQTGTGQATAVPWSATPTLDEYMEFHLMPDDEYMINTLVATPAALVKYLTIDPTYQSGNTVPQIPRMRSTVETVSNVENYAKKSTTQVPILMDANPRMIGFDRRVGVDYIVERRSMISEQERNSSTQTLLITNSHRYAFHLCAESSQCRYLVTMG